MRFDRRQFLVAGTAAAVGCPASPGDSDPPTPPDPTPVRDPSPEPPAPALPQDDAVFPRGVQVGDATSDAALAILHTTAPSAELVWMSAVDGAWVDGGRVPVPLDAGHGQVELTGLPADSAIAVWAEADGVASRPARFRTAPGARRRIRIGATSCLGGTNPGMANLGFVPEHDLDFMLLLGDTVYADGSVTREDYEGVWRRRFEDATVRDLFSGAGVLATWDDHEIANNWTLGEGGTLEDQVTQEQLDAGTAVWRESVPMRLGPQGSRVWRAHRWGPDLDVFLLDCRGERSPGQVVSDVQLEWIVQALAASTARFKLVCVSVHLTDHFELMSIVADEDRWQGYPEQRAALVSAALGVPGVLFVTGDMHYGAVQRVDPTGGPGQDLWEIAAGPSGSRLFPITGLAEALGGFPAQYDTVVEDWSWTVIDLDPGTGEVLVQFVGDDGVPLAERTLQL